MENMKKLFSVLFFGLLFGGTAMADNIIVNGDFSGNDLSAFYKVANSELSGLTSDDITVISNNPCATIVSVDDATDNWDTQFFVVLPQQLTEGASFRFTMRARATRAVTIGSWFESQIGGYQTYKGVGDFDLTTSWKTFVSTGVVDSDMAGAQVIAFNLNVDKSTATYYFDDFTFEMLIPATPEPVELVTNGSFTGSDLWPFSKRLGVESSFEVVTSSDIVTQSGNSFLKIVSIDNSDNPDGNSWDSMFFVRLNNEVKVGDSYTFSMRAKASRAASISSQFHRSPGQYIYWNAAGTFNLTTEWQTFTYTGTLTQAMLNGSDFGNPQTIAFELNVDPNSNVYYFDDISFMVTRPTETDLLSPDVVNGLIYSYDDQTNEATVIACPRTGDVTVPATIVVNELQSSPYGYGINTQVCYSVTSVDDAAFQYQQLTSVSLPNTIKSIGKNAFANNSLTSITLPTSLETIGEGAFSYNDIKHVSFPNGLKTIGAQAFYYNMNLYDLWIPSSVESIGDQAFFLCMKLGTIICKMQTPIDLPANVFFTPFKPIDLFVPSGCKGAFETAANWSNLNVSDDNVTYMTRSGIRYLHYVADDHLEVLPDLYSGDITIPQVVLVLDRITGDVDRYPVTAIRDMAFFDCTDLTSITFSSTSNSPCNVTSIGMMAFDSCTGLTSVNFPASLTTIGDGAFQTTGLSSVTIPETVTNIGVAPFSFCNNLTSIEVDVNNPNYDSRNNCNAIIQKEGDVLIQGCPNTIIPNNVTIIDKKAFYDFSGLTEINIPESVTVIGESAFIGTGLTEITFPEGLLVIGTSAFSYCENLNTAIIPSTVIYIGDNAFYNCSNLTTVYSYAMTPPTITAETTFSNAANATLYVPYGTKRTYQEAPFWQNFGNIESIADVTDVTLTIGSTGEGTFASTYDLNFSNVTGMKAYIASGYNHDTGKLLLTRVTEVPAGTGLYVKGTAGDYTIPVQETSMYLHNMLVGVTEATRVYPTDATGEYTNYIFARQNGKVGFFPASANGTKLSAGKAYLTIPTWAVSAQVGPILLEFDDEETTGITNTECLSPNEGTWYTIDGQKLDGKPTQKGVYIVNGKKQVVK